jgi:hypothetical protein
VNVAVMVGGAGTCTRCGATTPLPGDLTTPTFPCAYCGAVLSTAAVAGASVVSADRFVGHLQGAIANPSAYRPGEAPRFDNGNLPRQPGVSSQDQFVQEMARQLAGNQALARLRAEGVTCPQCGGHNAVPDDGSVQVICVHCKSAIVLSSLVPADAIARSRLKRAMHGMRGQAAAAGKKRDQAILLTTFGVIVLAAVTVLALYLSGTLSH